MEDAPAELTAENTISAAVQEKKCDCSCSRGLLCARKREALEKRASLAVFMQDALPQRTTEGPL